MSVACMKDSTADRVYVLRTSISDVDLCNSFQTQKTYIGLQTDYILLIINYQLHATP